MLFQSDRPQMRTYSLFPCSLVAMSVRPIEQVYLPSRALLSTISRHLLESGLACYRGGVGADEQPIARPLQLLWWLLRDIPCWIVPNKAILHLYIYGEW